MIPSLPTGYKLDDKNIFTPPSGYKLDTEKTSKDFESAGNEISRNAPSYAGRFAVAALPALAAGLTDGLSIPAQMGATALASGLGMAAKASAPSVFGAAPEGVGSGLGDMALDQIANVLVPGAGKALLNTSKAKAISSALFRNFPAVRSGAATEMTRQAMGKYQFPESGILESAAQNAENNKSDLVQNVVDAYNKHSQTIDTPAQFLHPEVKQALADHENTFAKNAVGQQLDKLNKEFQAGGDVAGSQTYKSIASTALSDLTHVRNFKLATGEGKTVEQLALNDLVTGGFKESGGKLDSAGILNKLGGSKREIYEEAIGSKTLDNFKDAMSEIEKQKAGHGISDALVRYSNRGLALSLPASMLGIHVGESVAGAAAPIALTNVVLSRLMANPDTAKAVVTALRTSSSAPQAGILGRVIANAIRGAEIPALTKEQ